MPLPAYAIVSPVRDEAEHLRRTIDSVAAQTHRPAQWVIVDDGSSDATPDIAAAAAAEHEWIRIITRPARAAEARGRGKPIIEAFEAGLAELEAQHEIVVKLDGDLYLAPHYFAWVAEVFANVARAGIVGGVGLIPDGDRWVPDAIARHTVVGYAKSYRRACLDEIGGLHASMGWDGIDEYGARARGWTVHVLTELPILHYRRRGAAQSWWRARWDEGRGNAFMGYLPAFVLLRAGYRGLVERPPVLGGIVLLAGWAWARLSRLPTVPDEGAKAELRAEQRRRMHGLLGPGRGREPGASLPGGGPGFWER